MKISKIIKYFSSFDFSLKEKLFKIKKISKKKYIKRNVINFINYFNFKVKKINKINNSIVITGTGGDEKYTFNISSILSIILSFINIPIYKYGSVSFSSNSGSLDFFKKIKTKYLNNGYFNLIKSKEIFKKNTKEKIKKLNKIRKIYRKRSIFNYVFPLLNPSSSKYRIIGSCSNYIHEIISSIEKKSIILMISGLDSMDEVTILKKTKVTSIKNRKISSFIIDLKFLKYKKIGKYNIKNVYSSLKIFEEIISKKNILAKNFILANMVVIFNFFFKKKNYFFFIKMMFNKKLLSFLKKLK